MILKRRRAVMAAGNPYAPPPAEYQTSPEQRVLWACLQVLDRLSAVKGENTPVLPATKKPAEAERYVAPRLASIERFRADHEARVSGLVERRFQEEERVVLAALRRAADPISPDALDGAVTASEGRWLRLLETIYETVGGPAGARAMEGFKVAKAIKVPPAMADWLQPLADYLRRKGAEKVQEISETTRKKLRRALADGIEAEDTKTQLVTRIQGAFQEMSKGRAKVIARNEVLAASSMANFSAAKASGVKLTKTWRTAGDKRVRDAHRRANGQVRKFDQPYNVGGERLMHPQDDSLGASPENIIQCRCVELYTPVKRRKR